MRTIRAEDSDLNIRGDGGQGRDTYELSCEDSKASRVRCVIGLRTATAQKIGRTVTERSREMRHGAGTAAAWEGCKAGRQWSRDVNQSEKTVSLTGCTKSRTVRGKVERDRRRRQTSKD